jgi:anti-sigma regulatory factor (Ser/Thr protein kinase)
MCRSRLQILAAQGEIGTALEGAVTFCAANCLPAAISNSMVVALDELLSNIVKFAYRTSKPGVIDIELAYSNGTLTAVIEDYGVAFNPLQVKAPDFPGELKSRKEGGLGIFFVKNLMESVEYERHGGRNRITLMTKVPAV